MNDDYGHVREEQCEGVYWEWGRYMPRHILIYVFILFNVYFRLLKNIIVFIYFFQKLNEDPKMVERQL